ncbi:hypothetical protein [Roseateles chitinivorans]|uniref:hypothetical protein n=1 Tax=Roseateles chitinivorans TaxID=2917965 RepID=UPI003D66FF93
MSGIAVVPPPTILVLDDFPDSADALCEWLTLEGWKAQCAVSADEALQKLRVDLPAVVVMEPWLRTGSAMGVAAAVRQAGGDNLLVGLTAWGRAEDDLVCGPTLFDVMLRKPVDGLALREALDHHPRASRLARYRAPPSSGAAPPASLPA